MSYTFLKLVFCIGICCQVFADLPCLLDIECSLLCENPNTGTCETFAGSNPSQTYCNCDNTCNGAVAGTNLLVTCAASNDFVCPDNKILYRCSLTLLGLLPGYGCCNSV